MQTAQFDLTLDTYESSNGLLAELTYATDLFDASSAERIAGHWLNLLRSIVARPEARIAELKLLDEAEARADLLQWNPGPQDFTPASCLHRLIERQAAERPRATAVVYGERALDYGELNLRANRLAHRLIELGVGPDVLVGLAAERSLEMIVGLLAISAAGGAYVPLDPRYPSDRLGYMIEDSGIRLLLTQRAARERLPLGEGLPCLLLDAEHEWAGYPESDPQSAVGVDNLAYVIYTSGSTGKPKVPCCRMATCYACSMPLGTGSVSPRTTPGACSTPTRSISPSGRSSAHCCMAAGWSSSRTRPVVRQRTSCACCAGNG